MRRPSPEDPVADPPDPSDPLTTDSGLDADPGRHDAAVAQFRVYLALLGAVVTPVPGDPVVSAQAARLQFRFMLKLEYGDGSWDIEEAQLGSPPRVGEYVDLGVRGRWQVRGTRVLLAAIQSRVEREFFVCAYIGSAPA
jgi:hypothetical protein